MIPPGLLAVRNPVLGLSAPSHVRHVIQHQGLEREYHLHVPTDAPAPAPMVIVMHGGGQNWANMIPIAEFSRLADLQRFIAAYPVGLAQTWNDGSGIGWAAANGIDDVGFLAAMIADIGTRHAVDPQRIFATGISKGGMMAYYLAAGQAQLIAAIAPVACTLSHPPSSPMPSRAVPLFHIHGDSDQNVPFDGGSGPKTQPGVSWPPVLDGVRYWAAIAGSDLSTSTFSQDGETITRYEGTAPDATVQYVLCAGHGHAWPGMRPQIANLDPELAVNLTYPATLRIWDFFVAHPIGGETAEMLGGSANWIRTPSAIGSAPRVM